MNPDPDLIVTTSRLANRGTREVARHKAQAWDLPYVERSGLPIDEVLGAADAAFVFRNDGLVLSTASTELRFDIGTAAIRLLSLERNQGDQLVRAGGLEAGDRVLDATLGLGRDALVAARAVGPEGEVIAVESNRALFILVSEGLSSLETIEDSAVIQPVHCDSRRFLSEVPTASFDIVVIDPMFAEPMQSDGNFESLRDFADHEPLDAGWVTEARRVAKRWVLVKASRGESWFGETGLERIEGLYRSRWWRAPGGA